MTRRSIDDPSIAPVDRSTVRRSRVDRAIDRSPRRSRRVRVFSRCRAAVRPRRDRADATRARAHTAARGALTTVRSRRRSRRASASRATPRDARDDDDDANRDADRRRRESRRRRARIATTTGRRRRRRRRAGRRRATTTTRATRTRTTTVDARTRDDGRRGVARRRARERIGAGANGRMSV